MAASFVQALRMRNMFPVNTDMGSANIDLSGPDPMQEVIAAYNNQVEHERMRAPRTGIQQVAQATAPRAASSVRPTINPDLHFGGVVNGDPGPGREMNDRAGQETRAIYDSYKQPLNKISVRPPSNDENNTEDYFKRKNEETRANATLAMANNADNKGWQVSTITDPADPSKQTTVRVNKITGEVQPVDMNGGVMTRLGSAGDIQKANDAKAARVESRKSVKESAQQALDEMNNIIDDKGNLTDDAKWAVGGTGIGNFIPGTPGASGAAAIKRVKDILTLQLIQNMKNHSKNGATGFGQMNIRELGVLEGGASKLDTGIKQDTFQTEAQRVKGYLKKILANGADDSDTGNDGSPKDNTTPNGNRIKVRNKKTGQTGTISSGAFDSNKYEKVQ